MKKITSISFFLLLFMFFGVCSFLFAAKAQAEIVSPDLTVTDITFSGSQKGETGKLAVTIKNLGGDLNNTAGLLNVYNNFNSQNFIFSSSTPSFLHFQTDRDLPDPSTNNPLKTDETITFYWYGSFNNSGNLDLEYVVDNANELDESDEENNTYSKVIEIKNIKQPDIVGDFVSVREGDNENKTLSRIPEVGEKFYLWLVYKNIGDIKMDNNDFNVDIYVDDVFKEKIKASNIDMMANLGDGMYVDDKIELALEEGLHEVKFILDSDNNIQESDETNNVFTWRVNISDNENEDNSLKPDLVIRGVHLPSAEDKRFVVEVRNNGNAATSFSDGIKVSATVRNSDNTLVALERNYAYLENLSPNTYKSAEFNITGATSEEIVLTIWVDNADNGDGGFIDESNEDNNIFTKTITMNQDDNENEDNSDDNSDNNNNDFDDDNNNTNKLVLQFKRQITALEKQVIGLEKKLTILDQKFANKYSGTMFLDVENHGRLWYVDPISKNRFYFENGASALSIGSKLATGITFEDIQKIPVGVPEKLYNLKDSDGDGLPDRLESALGSDPNKSDTDGDGYSDKDEIENGYSPINNNKYNYNQSLTERLEGKMLLQVSGPNSHGEIWYVKDGKRWYGGTEDSMYEIMKARSLGATSENIRKIEVGDVIGVE